MGTSSSSIINSALNDSLETTNQITQATQANSSCNQIVTLENCEVDGDIDLSCDQFTKTNLRQGAEIKASNALSVAQALQAQSEAKGQNISLNPGKTESDSTINSITNLSETMQNTITQNTNVKNATNQMVNCKGGGAAGNIYLSSKIDAVLDAAQKAVIDSSQGQNLKQDMSAKSKAVTENAITSVIIAVALCLAVVFIGPEVGVGIIVKDVFSSKIFYLVGLVGAVVFWFYAIRSCGFLSKKHRGWPCYKGCLYSPPTSFGGALVGKIPIAKDIFKPSTYTMLNNPCCSNCPDDDAKNCIKDEKKNFLNKQCFNSQPEAAVVCTPDTEGVKVCNKHQDDLATTCKWMENGTSKSGKCEGHVRKGVALFLLGTILLIIFIAWLLYDAIKKGGNGFNSSQSGVTAKSTAKSPAKSGGAQKTKKVGFAAGLFGFGGDTRTTNKGKCGTFKKCSAGYKACREGHGLSISSCDGLYSRLFGKKK